MLRKTLKPQNRRKTVARFSILYSYVDELKGRINSDWIALSQAGRENVLTSDVSVYALPFRPVRAGVGHYAQTNKKFELMLTRRAKAYSSSDSVV